MVKGVQEYIVYKVQKAWGICELHKVYSVQGTRYKYIKQGTHYKVHKTRYKIQGT